MRTRNKFALRFGLVALSAGLILSMACSDDDDDEPAAVATATSTTTVTAPSTLNISGIDYGFVGLPSASVAVGSSINFKNDSSKELHELVAMRLPDSEKRPVKDLLTLSDEELGEIISEEPAMVLIAPPTQPGFAVLGDGKFTQAGRYAILCFIPVGADPAAYMEAAQSGEQPEGVDGGPPHAFQGMIGEIIVK